MGGGHTAVSVGSNESGTRWKAAEAGQLGVAAVSYLPGSVGRVIDDYKVCNIKNKHFIGFLRLKYSSQLNYRRALDIIKRKAGYYR